QSQTGRTGENGGGDSLTYRQIFWPYDRETIVSISSQRPGAPIDVSHVKVFYLGEELPANPVAGPRASAVFPPGSSPRLVGRYLRKPALSVNFAAPQVVDPVDHIGIDDWQTFFVAGRRLTEYL